MTKLAKRIALIDDETGELSQIELKDDTSFIMAAVNPDGTMKYRGFQQVPSQNYQPKGAVVRDEPVVAIAGNRKYSKVFHVAEDVIFSKSSFYGIWWKIVTHLEHNTNAVYRIVKKKAVRCYKIQHLIDLSDCGKSLVYEFYKEAYNRKYMGEWRSRDGECYVVNPELAFNGQFVPLSVFLLFNPTYQWSEQVEIVRDKESKHNLVVLKE